jgi:hypothetical protein
MCAFTAWTGKIFYCEKFDIRYVVMKGYKLLQIFSGWFIINNDNKNNNNYY